MERDLRERADDLAVFGHLLGYSRPVTATALAFKTGLKAGRVRAALARLKAIGQVSCGNAGGTTWWFWVKKGEGRAPKAPIPQGEEKDHRMPETCSCGDHAVARTVAGDVEHGVAHCRAISEEE